MVDLIFNVALYDGCIKLRGNVWVWLNELLAAVKLYPVIKPFLTEVISTEYSLLGVTNLSPTPTDDWSPVNTGL